MKRDRSPIPPTDEQRAHLDRCVRWASIRFGVEGDRILSNDMTKEAGIARLAAYHAAKALGINIRVCCHYFDREWSVLMRGRKRIEQLAAEDEELAHKLKLLRGDVLFETW